MADAPEEGTMQAHVLSLLDHKVIQAVMGVLTVYALFGDDVRLMSDTDDPESTDSMFLGLSSLAFFAFIIEFLMSCFAKPGYLGTIDIQIPGVNSTKFKFSIASFYFWLDIIATASLITELTWAVQRDPSSILELDLGISGGGTASSVDAGGAVGAARAGRASRAGARAGRVIRLVRMVKLFKLYQSSKEDPKKGSGPGSTVSPEEATEGGAGEGEEEILAESHVGKTMGDLTTQRVIVGVLAMLIVLPLITYTTQNDSHLFSCRLMHRYHESRFENDTSWNEGLTTVGDQFIEDQNEKKSETESSQEVKYLMFINKTCDEVKVSYPFESDTDGSWDSSSGSWLKWESPSNNGDQLYPLLAGLTTTEFTEVMDGDSGTVPIPDKTRITDMTYIVIKSELEQTSASCTENIVLHTVAIVDNSAYTQLEAQYGFFMTWFVIVLLVTGTMVFSADTNRLVIEPIEKMIKRVQEISQDPMAPSTQELTGLQEGMETTFLVKTIDKIGNLMRIGFGEAGAEIIGKNLGDTKPGQKLNLLGGAEEIWSIFGFCDIRNFTDTTECLQTEVMTFVNKVAHVLHGIIEDCNGAANKNIGDAFLLSWKLPAAPNGESDPNTYASNHKGFPKKKQYLFDKALYAFLKFVAELYRNDAFICQFSAASAQRLYARMPGYTPRMGMGLHVGNAVEGAIGSDRKIDATYISRAVNYSEFLESSTKAYKVPLLMSGHFWEGLTPGAKDKTRKLDCVRQASGVIFALHTYDIDLDANYAEMIPVDRISQQTGGRRSSLLSSLPPGMEAVAEELTAPRLAEERYATPKVETNPYTTEVWNTDKDMLLLRNRVNHQDLMQVWEKGITAYINGDWPQAIDCMNSHQEKYGNYNKGLRDGPSDFLLDFMKSFPDNTAPTGWKGYHDV
mmetsp:Transcript_26988/g.63138  ORF Transcript_26988/g.63138 Transcript_26988/m.63138 type:complete len:906 (+) Transcript_26988:272-2989(+)|eukprot:CAMPEP_0182586262 /NCGR_PEP_ID=MMETSP1324-20130603/62162_1 /TAXON_ID=236786 /ORGANISM="Florenciella sp., Strain RCC1587" /LENGTH=905 /DNA_ID=CAMNT_0024803135 /DNA_START=255 /DNA_END=2972 /DNA_ORIENTATION=+